MQKTLHSPANQIFLTLLRACREEAGATQVELAERLGSRQADISKVERGVRRLDVVELRQWLSALGLTLSAFAKHLEEQLDAAEAIKQKGKVGRGRFPG